MKSTAKQEHNLNCKRNSYIPKMCVDPCAVGSTTDPPMDSHMSISKARIKFSQIFEF